MRAENTVAPRLARRRTGNIPVTGYLALGGKSQQRAVFVRY
jgi:hypothetical protein